MAVLLAVTLIAFLVVRFLGCDDIAYWVLLIIMKKYFK